MKFTVCVLLMLSLKEISTVDFESFGVSIGTKQYCRTVVEQAYTWEISRQTCIDYQMSQASVDSEAETVHLRTLLTGDSSRRYWTQGALAAYYWDGKLVDTPFMSVEYPFIDSAKNPSWCLVLGNPTAPNTQILVAEDCVDSGQNILCQMENAPCP